MLHGRFSVTADPVDEIPQDEADLLDRYLPSDAANTIRKMIRRAGKLNPWIQSFTQDFQAAQQDIVSLQKARDNGAQQIQQLQGALQQLQTDHNLVVTRVGTLEGQATQAAQAIQNIRQRLNAAGIP